MSEGAGSEARETAKRPPEEAAAPARTEKLEKVEPATVPALEHELLHELRRMNHYLALLSHSYRRFTMAFLGGMVRGLGAAIGATVVFAIFLGAFSRLDTTPIIGNYVRRILYVVKQSGPGSAFDVVLYDVQSSPSGAAIFVDGKPTDRSTPCDELPIPPGHHTIRLVKGTLDGQVEIDGNAGDTAKTGVITLH